MTPTQPEPPTDKPTQRLEYFLEEKPPGSFSYFPLFKCLLPMLLCPVTWWLVGRRPASY